MYSIHTQTQRTNKVLLLKCLHACGSPTKQSNVRGNTCKVSVSQIMGVICTVCILTMHKLILLSQLHVCPSLTARQDNLWLRLDLSSLKFDTSRLDRNSTNAIYCRSGISSQLAWLIHPIRLTETGLTVRQTQETIPLFWKILMYFDALMYKPNAKPNASFIILPNSSSFCPYVRISLLFLWREGLEKPHLRFSHCGAIVEFHITAGHKSKRDVDQNNEVKVCRSLAFCLLAQ